MRVYRPAGPEPRNLRTGVPLAGAWHLKSPKVVSNCLQTLYGHRIVNIRGRFREHGPNGRRLGCASRRCMGETAWVRGTCCGCPDLVSPARRPCLARKPTKSQTHALKLQLHPTTIVENESQCQKLCSRRSGGVSGPEGWSEFRGFLDHGGFHCCGTGLTASGFAIKHRITAAH